MRSLVAHLRTLALGLAFGGVLSAGAILLLLAVFHARPAPLPPDPPSLVERVREVARLETLDVSVYKRVAFAPDPPASRSLAGDVATWATWTIDPPEGRAIVFADVHLGLDASKIDARALAANDDEVVMTLPPIVATVELRPAETEVVRSNLDTTQTGLLLDKAKWEIQRDVAGDGALKARARASAERALRALFLSAGYDRVRFVEPLAPAAPQT